MLMLLKSDQATLQATLEPAEGVETFLTRVALLACCRSTAPQTQGTAQLELAEAGKAACQIYGPNLRHEHCTCTGMLHNNVTV